MQLQKSDNRSDIDPEEGQQINKTYQRLGESKKTRKTQVIPFEEPIDDNEIFMMKQDNNDRQMQLQQLFKFPWKNEDDFEVEGVLDSRATNLDKWVEDFNADQKMDINWRHLFNFFKNMDNTYSGIMFLRRLTRVVLQFGFLALVVAFFIFGYFVTLKDEVTEFSSDALYYEIQCKNCWINIQEADGASKVHYRAMGEFFRQVNATEDYMVFVSENQNKVDMKFINPFPDVKYLIVDLYIPSLITYFELHCEEDSKCIVVVNHNLLEVNELFNITGGVKSDLQLNVMNLQVPQFNLNSKAGGAVYLNHIAATLLNLTLLSGPIVIQSKFDMDIQLSSNKHTFCMSGPQVSVDSLQTCYMDENTINYTTADICYGQIKVCQESGCIPNQQFNIIANSSTLYVNLIQDVGMLQVESDKLTILSSGPFKQGTIKFDEPSQVSIQQALNDSQNADLTLRLNIGGSLLLQQTSNTYWSFFNNEAYAAFDPWWLSVLSASLLGTQIFEVDAQLQPGFCPYYPVLNQAQVYLTKQTIEDLLYTDGSATIYQTKDNRPLPEIQLNMTTKYSGVEPLLIKQRNKIESWYKLTRYSDSISLEPLPYDVFFMISIALSILSAIIFAYIAIRILIIFMFRLESYVIDQATQIQNYSATTTGYSMESFTEVVQRMLAKKETVNLKKSPPMIYGVISYCLYVYAQSAFNNAAKVFCQTMFKKTNTTQTEQYYKQQLPQEFMTIDEKELKEVYEQLCYLNKLRVLPLNQESQLLKKYGFELEEKKDTSVFLCKIKMKPDRKEYYRLDVGEKNSDNSIELFMETQVLLTGIQSDILAYEQLEYEYNEFCGKVLQKDILNPKNLAKDYGLVISDAKNYELRKVKTFQQREQSWHTKLLGNGTHFIPFLENYHSQQPVYIVRRNTQIFNFQQNPLKTIEIAKLKWWYYNFVRMFIESLRFNYKTRLFNQVYSYREEEENNVAMDYFDAVYMNGWLWNEIIIVLGNMLVTGIAILPILFFLMLINTAYTPFALYDPRSLMYTQDILVRPWLFFAYDYTVDEWVLVITILVLYYAAASFVFQSIKYAFSFFPDEIGFMYEYKAYENKILNIVNWFQWIQFIILYFCVFTYFGVIIVWLVLGAIINPNNYLVYTSSALTLVITIIGEYRAVQHTFEQGCKTVNTFIGEIYLRTFGQVGPALIKEIHKLSDKSNGIINSSGMDKAQQMAQQLGFGQELNELCMTTQQMLNNGNAASIETDALTFNQIKDKFIEAACAKFVKIATEQFKIKTPIAEQLVKANFKFEEIMDTLANLIQIESDNKIPAGVIKWIYEASIQINQFAMRNNQDERRKDMEVVMPKLAMTLLDTVIESILIRANINDNENTQQILQSVVRAMHSIIISKNDQNVLKYIKLLFQNMKLNTNVDAQQIQALEMMFNYAQVLSESPKDFQLIQQDLIQEILSIFNVDLNISFIIQLVLSGGTQTQFKLKDRILESPSDIANQVINFQYKYIPISDNKDQQRFEILIFAIIKYIRNDKLPIKEIAELILESVNDNQSKKFLSDLYQNNQLWINNIGTLINLGSKNWKELSQLKLKGINQELAKDVLYLSSKYMWTLQGFDSSIEETGDYEQQAKNWDQEIWNKPAIQTPNRIQNLQGRPLIKIIADAFQFTEEALIGLVSILRGELDNTIYHNAAYQELSKVIFKVQGSDFVEIKQIIQILSTRDFENVSEQIAKSNNDSMIQVFLELCTMNLRSFVLFGGDLVLVLINKHRPVVTSIFDQISNQLIKPEDLLGKVIEQIKSKIQILKSENLKEDDIQFLNTFKAEKYTFYQYLRKFLGHQTRSRQEDEALKTLKTQLFNEIITSSNFRSEYLLMILELQTKLAQPSSAAGNINLMKGFNIEPFKNLIYLLQFKDTQMILRGLQFFIKANPEKYMKVDIFKLSNCLQTFIDIESSILSIQLPNTVPYQIQQLRPLFINNMVHTRLPISESAAQQLIGTFTSMYPLPSELQEYKKYAITVDKFIRILIPSANRSEHILEIINILVGPNRNNIKLSTFLEAVLNRDFNQLTNYLVIFFQCIEPPKFRKFFQKLTFIIQGLSSTQQCENDDSENLNIVWANQQLKYFLSYDTNAYLEFIEHFFIKTLNFKPNMNSIETLLSMFSDTPDFQGLNSLFKLDEESFRMAELIIEAMITTNKTGFLQRVQSVPQLLRMFTQKLKIKSLQPLTDISDLLEQNILDIPTLLRNLQLEPYAASTKLYTAFFSFSWQLKSTNSYSTNLQQYQKLANLRAEYFKQKHYDKPNQKNMWEILHWFGNPKPINFLYKVSSIEIMRPLGTTALIFSAIGSIAKYDITSKYKLKQPEQLRYVMNTANTLKSVSKAVVFIAENTEQDLTESFQILNLACGVDPVFASAILNEDENDCMQDILASQQGKNKLAIQSFLRQLNSYQKLDTFWRFYIIELETLENALLSDNEGTEILQGMVKQSQMILCRRLGLQQSEYQIIIKFITEQAQGEIFTQFPISTLILLYSLKHLRQCASSKIEHPVQKYLKATHLLDLSLTVLEKYLYFYDQDQFIDFNKPFLVHMLVMSIFDTPTLRAHGEIDQMVIEKLLYPGISDIFLIKKYYRGVANQLISKFGYQCILSGKENNLKELSRVIIQTQQEYQNIFIPLISNGNDQVNVKSYLPNVSEHENNYIIQKKWIVFNNMMNRPFYDDGEAKLPNLLFLGAPSLEILYNDQLKDIQNLVEPSLFDMLTMQAQYILTLQSANLTQLRFLRTKYLQKSLYFLKRYVLKSNEEDVLSSDIATETHDNTAINLMRYYLGQCSFVENKEDINKQEVGNECIIQIQPNYEYLQMILVRQQQPPKDKIYYKGNKSRVPINGCQFIDSLLVINQNVDERQQYHLIVDIMFNSKYIGSDQLKQLWNADCTLMNTIIMMLLRIHLEKSKNQGRFAQLANCIPSCFLYLSLGDKYENCTQEYINNNVILNLGMDKLLNNCEAISEALRSPLKLMLRCYLGDVEAWYTFIMFVRGKLSNHSNMLSEQMIRTFIISCLLLLKNMGLRNTSIQQAQLSQQSLLDLLKVERGFILKRFIERVLIETFEKNQEEFPMQICSKFTDFLDFIIDRKIDLIQNSFSDVLQCMLKVTSKDWDTLNIVSRILIQLLFKGQQNNNHFPEYEQALFTLDNWTVDKQVEWNLFKIILEILHSNDLKVAIVKVAQLLQNKHSFQKYINLMISLNAIQHIKYLPEYTSGILTDLEVIHILFYPVAWIATTITEQQLPGSQQLIFQQNKQQKHSTEVQQFIDFCSQLIEDNQSGNKFLMMLNIINKIETITNTSNQILLTPANIQYYVNGLNHFGKQHPQSYIPEALNIISDLIGHEYPSEIQMLINAFTMLVGIQNDQSKLTTQLHLEKFISALADHPSLVECSGIIKAAIIGLSKIQDPKQLKGDDFIQVLQSLLSNSPKVMNVVNILMEVYNSKNICELNYLPVAILDMVCDEGNAKLQDEVSVNQIFTIVTNTINLFEHFDQKLTNSVNEGDLLKLIKPILSPIFTNSNEGQKDLHILIKCLEAFIALKQKKYSQINVEFFQIMKISPQNSQLIIKMMLDFQVALQSPQNLIKEKLQSFVNPNIVGAMQYMSNVAQKIQDNTQLQYEDMFKILDKTGQKEVSALQLLEFLQRIHIQITDHKFREVLVAVKKKQVQIETTMIDIYEFKELMKEISDQTMYLALEYLGISADLLMRGLILLIVYLVLVIGFILIGVQAFALPGTFASIINSILPILGGFGLSKQSEEDRLKIFNNSKINEIIKQAVKVIQSQRV